MSDPLGFLDRPASDEPSEWLLDRYAAGELDGADQARVEAWLASRPEARARLEARRSFPPALDREALFRRIVAAGGTSPASARPEPWWRRLVRGWGAGFLAVAVAAAVALLVVRPWEAPTTGGLYPDPDELRMKGGLDFLVHRQVGGGSELLVSGGEAREGDRLRFEVALPGARYVMIVDQDPSGALATAWPLDGSDAARPLPPEARALDGAVELDDALGKEWLHAISCEHPLALSEIKAKSPGELDVPDGCQVVPFLLVKVARR